MKSVGRKKTVGSTVAKVGGDRVARLASPRDPERVKRYPALYAYFDSLRPGEPSSALGAMVFVLEYFAKRGIVLGDGGRPLGPCPGDPTEFLEQHRQLALLMLALGEELGLSTLFPDSGDAPAERALDGWSAGRFLVGTRGRARRVNVRPPARSARLLPRMANQRRDARSAAATGHYRS